MKKLLIAFLLFSSSAFAGGSNPNLYYGFTPTAAQWNSYFANKLDYTPGTVNQMSYWDGSGNFLNAAVSGDCTSVANAFTCSKTSGMVLFSSTAPTISSGFGTSPSIVTANGTAAFSINVGTGAAASSGVIALPAAAHDYNCAVINPITGAGTFTQQTAWATTSATFTNYTIATDVAVAWPASYILRINCVSK